MLDTPEYVQNCRILLAGHFKRSSKNKSCQALAARLGLNWHTVAMISNGGYCGQRTASKLRRLVANPGSVRDRSKDQPRLYVGFPQRAQIEFIEKYTTPEQRRQALFQLAQQQAQLPPAQ